MTFPHTHDLHTAHDVADAARITYRQLDYWLRRGYLGMARHVGIGSGTTRAFTDTERDRVAVFSALVHAGVEPSAAARVVVDTASWRRTESGWLLFNAELGPGVSIHGELHP